MPYSEILIKPMREDLTRIGVEETRSPEQVEEAINNTKGTLLVVVNSVCGCAAGMARPGVRLASQSDRRPDRVATVFAGQDLEATARARSYFPDIPPSSPSIAFFKDGEVVYFMPRHRIEGRDAQTVAHDLMQVFAEHCPVPAV